MQPTPISNNKNTIQNATVTAGGNIHIGDIYNPNSPLQPDARFRHSFIQDWFASRWKDA